MKNPQVLWIDPLDVIQYQDSRLLFFDAASERIANGIVFENQTLKIPLVTPIVSEFPVIVKPISTADDVEQIISLALNEQGLTKCQEIYKNEMIMQEFIQHDEIVYKCVALGKHVWYVLHRDVNSLGNEHEE